MNVIFLGPPGAGKGTIAARIKDTFALDHLSTGDMLREEMKGGTELGTMAKSYIDKGELVPDDVIIGMVANRLEKTQGGVLFDGFPRTVEQADALAGICRIDAVVNLDTTVDVIVDRICSRRVCSACGNVTNVKWLAPGETACQKCGGQLITRADDNEETVRNRFAVYQAQTAPLVAYYEGQGLLYTFDANDDIDRIAGRISKLLGEIGE